MRSFLLLLIALPIAASSQVIFQTTYNGPADMYDAGHAVIQTSDGGYAAVGITSGNNVFDGLLIRFGAGGDTLWSKKYDLGGYFEYLTDLFETDDGGFMLCGYVAFAQPMGGPLLIRTNDQGDTLWTHRYPACNGYDQDAAMTRLSNGWIAVTGQSQVNNNAPLDMYRFFVDGNGTEISSSTAGGPARDAGHDIAQFMNGGLVIVGEQRPTAADSSNMAMWIYDNTFAVIATLGYGTPEAEDVPDNITSVAYAVEPCQSGGFIVAGMVTDSITGDTNAVFIRVSQNLTFQWTLVLGDVGPDIGHDIVECASGNFDLLWSTDTTFGTWQVTTVDPDGQVLSTNQYGDPGYYSSGRSISACADGNLIVTGMRYTGGLGSAGQRDLHLTKISGSCYPLTVAAEENSDHTCIPAWPNPFMFSVTVPLPSASADLVVVSDPLGHQVRSFINARGEHLTWNGQDTNRTEVPNGMYFISVWSNGQYFVQRVIKQ